MKFLRRSMIGLFLLAATLAGLTLAGQQVVSAVQSRLNAEERTRPARERVFAANVVTVQAETVTPVLRTFGEVRSRRTLDIRAKSAGSVVELVEGFEEGARVSAGQLLFRVDPAQAQSDLATAEANLTEAQAALRDAQRDFGLSQDDLAAVEQQADLRARALERQQNLLTSGFGSTAQVEDAELAAVTVQQSVVSRRQAVASAQTRVDQSASDLARAEIALTDAQRQLADTEVYAEFDGSLSDVTLVRGGLVANNEQVARLIDANALEVSFRISTVQYTRLLDAQRQLINAPLTITLEAFGAELVASGVITRESAAVAEGQTGRLLFARLEQAGGFRPGDFVTVEVAEPLIRNASIIPSTAVDAAGTVLVVTEDERLEVQPVDVLRRQGDDIIVRAAALIGREIVSERSPLLGAGIKVRPVRPIAQGDQSAAAPPPEPEELELSDERRAALIAFVQSNNRMPAEAKERMLGQLNQEKVPARTVERLESRMGG